MDICCPQQQLAWKAASRQHKRIISAFTKQHAVLISISLIQMTVICTRYRPLQSTLALRSLSLPSAVPFYPLTSTRFSTNFRKHVFVRRSPMFFSGRDCVFFFLNDSLWSHLPPADLPRFSVLTRNTVTPVNTQPNP